MRRGHAVLLVSTVAVACCSASLAGPSLAANSPATKISPQFVDKTDQLCATINAKFSHVLGNFPFSHFDPTKPDLKTLPLVGKHFAKALAIRHAIPGELRALGEPASGEPVWLSIRSLALQANATAVKQVSDALASDTKGFVATVNEISKVHDAFVAKAVAAGFSKTSACGQVF